MLLFLDVETTGFDPTSSELLELSAVRYDGEGVVATFDELICPSPEGPLNIPPVVERLTGITPEMLSEGNPLEIVRFEFLEKFLHPDDIIVGHNISFDTGFLQEKGFAFSHAEIDTYPLSTIILPSEESYSLEVLTEKYNLPHEAAHRALGDVLGTLEFWKFLEYKYHADFSKELQKTYAELLEKTNWTGKHFFSLLANPNPENFTDASVKRSFREVRSKASTSKEKKFVSAVESFFQKKESALWEVSFSFPSDPLFLAVEAISSFCKKTKETVYISYSPERENFISDFFHSLKNTDGVFYEKYFSSTLLLNEKKWGVFLGQQQFSEEEIIVALKVLRDRKRGAVSAPNLYRKEWSVWRQIAQGQVGEGGQDALLEKKKAGRVVFVPERHLSEIQGEYLFLDGAEDLEDILTSFATQSGSSLRVRSFSKQASVSLQEDISFFFDLFGAFLRKIVGEHSYPLDIPFDASLSSSTEWVQFSRRLQELVKKSKKELGSFPFLFLQLSLWFEFFSSPAKENVLLFFRLFPNDEIEWRESPTLLSSSCADLSKKFPSLLALGSHFSKKEDGAWVFPFELPPKFSQEKISLVQEMVPFQFFSFSDVSPSQNTPRASLEYLKKLIASSSGNVLAHFSSQKNAEHAEEFLFSVFPDSHFDIVSHRKGGLGKILHFLQKPGRKIFLTTTPLLQRIQKSFSLFPSFNIFFFQKFLFDPPQKTLFAARKKFFSNEFLDFVLPRSLGRFETELFRLNEMQSIPYSFYCFDARINDSSGFGGNFAKMSSDISLNQISLDKL